MKYILLIYLMIAVDKMYSQDNPKWMGFYTDSTIIVDLANDLTSDIHISPNKRFDLYLINKLPSNFYNVNIELINYKVDNLALPALKEDDVVDKKARESGFISKTDCDIIKRYIANVFVTKDEHSLLEKKFALYSEIQKHLGTDDLCLNTQLKIATDLLNNTVTKVTSISIDEFVEAEVIISRPGKKWKFKITPSGKPGFWKTSFGMNFNLPIPFKNEAYTLIKQDNDDPKLVCLKNNFLNYVPTVLFSYLNKSSLKSKFQTSLTGGLSYDLKSPSLYVGWQATYRQNITFSTGVSLAQLSRLNPKYNTTYKFKELLSDDQLILKGYLPVFAFGIYYGFTNNPFK